LNIRRLVTYYQKEINMAKLLTERVRMEIVDYTHDFIRKADRGSGWTFPVDEQGNFDTNTNKDALANWVYCTEEVKKPNSEIIDEGVQRRVHSYWEPATVRCHCGEIITLSDHFANMCEKCETEYGFNGGQLAPRSQWGYETGENF
jgi:hypothetical protein